MIKVLDSKDELNKFSIVCSSRLVVSWVDSSSEEEDEMLLNNRKKGLHELLKVRGSGPKDASRSQPPFPPPSHPSPSVNPFAPANLKKEKEVAEEGDLVPKKEEVPPKHQKTTKGKGRASLVEGKDDRGVAEVRLQNPIWEPRLELNRVAIPRNSTIREF